MPLGESLELLEGGRGAAQLPGGQQDGLILRHLLEGTAHTCAEVWHIAHGHGQLRETKQSAGCTPHTCMYRAAQPTPTTPLTCTPGDVTDTLLGRTRTWTHLLSSSAKPCGAEAPGQAPSRQHLCGVRPEPIRHLPWEGPRGPRGERAPPAQPTVPGNSVPQPCPLGSKGRHSEWRLRSLVGESGRGGRGGHKGTAGRSEHVGQGRCCPH